MYALIFFCRNCRRRESQGYDYLEVPAGEEKGNADGKVSAIDWLCFLTHSSCAEVLSHSATVFGDGGKNN